MSSDGQKRPSAPYPGLRPFREHESEVFFGREEQVGDMLAKLEDHRFLAVVGTSGCGKSSLVHAGLIPALKQGLLMDAGDNWRIARMRPGSAPFSQLTAALLKTAALGPERGEDEDAAAYLMAILRRGPLGLVEAVQESHLQPETNLLVLVDQFEEIFRFREQTKGAAEDATAFVNLLLAASDPSAVNSKLGGNVRIYVAITMRSDFIGDCALFMGFPEAINDSQFLTPRLTRDQYRAAIVEPARVFGGELKPDLVNRLLNDMRGSPDQLPLFQHVLMRMWTRAEQDDQADAKRLTVADYEAVGGLSQALSKHCDEVLAELSDQQQAIAQGMFRCLCERGSDQRDTRKPTNVATIRAVTGASMDELRHVVDAFRAPGRTFLMPPIGNPLDDDTVLDISHESLIRQWGTLNEWVVAEARSAEIYTRLEREARSWAEFGKEPGALWRTPNLDMALQWLKEEKPGEAWTRRYGSDFELAREFLRSSEKQRDEEQRKAEEDRKRELERAQERERQAQERAEEQARFARRLKLAVLAIAGALIITGILAHLAWQAKEEVEAQRIHAEEQKQLARNEEQRARKLLARYFANVSKITQESYPVLSLLLAIKAMSTLPMPATEEALREALMGPSNFSLRGHEFPVWSVAYSPNGKQLASASADYTVRLWNLENLDAEPIILRGHADKWVRSVAYSPNGKQLASASSDGTVKLWNLDNPSAELIVLLGHESDIWSVAYSPDGKQLASASADYTVRLWDLENLDVEPIILRGHEGSIWSVAYSPDGKQLASGSADKTVRLWNLENLDVEPIILCGHEEAIQSVAYSPNGKQLASGSDDSTVRLWDLENLTARPSTLCIHASSKVCLDSPIGSVAYSPDGKQLASGSPDNTIKLWSLDSPNANPIVLHGHEGAIGSIVYSPDGKQLASGSLDNTIRLWNIQTSEIRLWNIQTSELLKQACRVAGRNMTYGEWYTFLEEEPYSKVCYDLPYHQSFLEKGRDLAKHGNVTQALEFFKKTLKLDGTSGDIQAEARKLVAPVFIENGQQKAKQIDIEGAVAEFEKAIDFDPNIDLHPRTEASRIAARVFVERGELEAAISGDPDVAKVWFQRAKDLDKTINPEELLEKVSRSIGLKQVELAVMVAQQGELETTIRGYSQPQVFGKALQIPAKQVPATKWNALCWQASIRRKASEVMRACDNAVSLDPENGMYKNSRGVARALTGDFNGAIEDFKYYVDWAPKNGQEKYVPKRKSWIKALEAGQNPFDAQTLEALKTE